MRDGASPPQQGLLCSCASWPWGIGEETTMPELKTWWLEGMEGGDGALRFFLQFDPGKVDRTTLLGVSLSALFTRFLGWAKNAHRRGPSMAITDDAAVSAAALAAAVSVCLAAMHASAHNRRRRPRLSAPALAGGPSSAAAARPRALPAPTDGLRILSSSSKDASSENVIHGASIGAWDDEPVIVARVAETAQATDGEATEEHGQPEDSEREEESERLSRELWLSLVEREQRLELRLHELEGLREQEEAATARELESRVSAAAMEARLLQLKVASLQEENGRLRARLEEMHDARAELARAKDKLRAIKARVQGEQEEQAAAALRARVAELEIGREERANAMAAEAAALREANAALEEENMELALRLREAEQAASSVHLALQEDMAEEAKRLRESNESLTRQIEELRSDQYAHVEELVYLKWVNACLRHELSDHGLHPPRSLRQEDHDADDGHSLSSAMELSKSMSYRSSERAKQLMLRYGHPGLVDPALLSPLHESMDGGDDERTYYESSRSPAGTSSVGTTATPAAASTGAAAAPGKKKSGPRKLKLLGNIKKLLPGGKRISQSCHGPAGGGGRESSRQAPAPAPSDEYLEKAMQWLSTHDVLDLDRSYESTPLSSCDRTPPSSVTTTATTTRGQRGGASSTRQEEDAAPTTLSRSRSDADASYGREARSRYHSLRPDHPADETGVTPPETQREPRRRSEELMSFTS